MWAGVLSTTRGGRCRAAVGGAGEAAAAAGGGGGRRVSARIPPSREEEHAEGRERADLRGEALERVALEPQLRQPHAPRHAAVPLCAAGSRAAVTPLRAKGAGAREARV